MQQRPLPGLERHRRRRHVGIAQRLGPLVRRIHDSRRLGLIELEDGPVLGSQVSAVRQHQLGQQAVRRQTAMT